MKIPADFDAEIWSVVAEIPAGRVATYGQLARLMFLIISKKIK